MVGEFVLAATTVDSRAAVAMVTPVGSSPQCHFWSVSSSGHRSVTPSGSSEVYVWAMSSVAQGPFSLPVFPRQPLQPSLDYVNYSLFS